MVLHDVLARTRPRRDGRRRWAAALGGALVAGVVAVAVPGMQAPASAAGPRPDFQLPFPCDQKWRLDSWGHAPALDMVKEPQSETLGAQLVAPADGVVEQSFRHGNAGNMIQIDHGGDWFTTYIHLQSRAVQVGDRVTQGQNIGRVGKDGPTSNGVPHLHFETAIDTNGDGRASWGTSNSERVRPWFNGVEYGQSNGRTWRNVESNNCGQSPPAAAVDDGVKVAGDFNGDGRDDVAAMYGYASGRVALFTFGANATGGFGAPVKSWETAPGNWTFGNVKLTTGDANGDGRDDVAAMYGYADGRVALFTFLANPDGGFAAPVKSWETPAGNWTFKHVRLVGGDFNGDGRDDVGAMYGYADGKVAMFTFVAGATGGFGAPVKSWETAPGNWTFARVKLATGDYNGDGRDDVAAFYGYADDRAAMFTFVADAAGGFAAPVKSWETPAGNWYFQHVKLASGDYNGDGRDDVGAMYGYASGRVALFTFGANATGGFGAPVKSWEAAPGAWTFARVKLTSGDSNGDGRDDLAAFYGYADDSAAMFTFGGNPDGGFANPVKSWETAPGNWYFAHVKIA
jgi:hypothetical protein